MGKVVDGFEFVLPEGATGFKLIRTETRADTNNAPPVRRVGQFMTMDGRIVTQDFDYESAPVRGLGDPSPVEKLPTVQEVLNDPASKYRRKMGTAWRVHLAMRLLPEPLPEGRAKRARDDEEV